MRFTKYPREIYSPGKSATTLILEALENNGADLEQHLIKTGRNGGGIMTKQSFSSRRGEPFTLKRSEKRIAFHKSLVNVIGVVTNKSDAE